MKTFAAAATLLAAAPAALGQFVGLSVRSASPIHYGSINAAGSKFWIGKETSSYCPSEVVDCAPYPGNVTVFAGGDPTLGLSTAVPGGQQVYIAPDGSLSFTQAHSAYIPEGSVTDGFTTSQSSGFGILSWTNGFIACPSANGTFPYQVYGGGYSNNTACLGFDFLTSNYTGTAGAWQYA
ncbi:hypothetical protein GTA08_BOTSDO10587 [Neofusicoccum parvum]|uniref:Putative-binding protein n=3 Tax=Neofusicoccum TaxID=407951 RepID=R1GSH0_BOTPV|nr:putative -binding protein [Neofusicoccum parvum UCRNP2]GME24325.1 hypothetical protein GTA08_BOTSDO10587 [Neofusicoccum parvum]GME40970.1 hypothetical protein GTA08_BOTSDO10587 [Neofusicoccum parvum]